MTCLGGGPSFPPESYFEVCWRYRWTPNMPSTLYYGFTFAIISIMISLVGFLNIFAVCITIKTIPTFPIWNYPPLLFRIIFCYFFFLFRNVSVQHIIFSTYQCYCIPLDIYSLIICLLFSYNQTRFKGCGGGRDVNGAKYFASLFH